MDKWCRDFGRVIVECLLLGTRKQVSPSGEDRDL